MASTVPAPEAVETDRRDPDLARRTRSEARRERQEISDLAAQLAALDQMTVGQLKTRYREIFGEPTRSRNKPYLKKKIAWRIQELAEGGLSDRARSRIEELADLAGPGIWKPGAKSNGANHSAPPSATAGPSTRDPRLPPPGTILRRTFRDVEHEVTVLEDGFEYQGQRYGSLSKIARLITSTHWNGFLFWGLKQRKAEVGSPSE